eukprot:gb/GECH01014452.1/.p1 GENE.gb/GECH01014452.1/~~gb/GECH01014452.1/.p1  ORF type:complete len:257 (+),score=57.22 gb/GECH01014452.1/:1-771(+)
MDIQNSSDQFDSSSIQKNNIDHKKSEEEKNLNDELQSLSCEDVSLENNVTHESHQSKIFQIEKDEINRSIPKSETENQSNFSPRKYYETMKQFDIRKYSMRNKIKIRDVNKNLLIMVNQRHTQYGAKIKLLDAGNDRIVGEIRKSRTSMYKYKIFYETPESENSKSKALSYRLRVRTDGGNKIFQVKSSNNSDETNPILIETVNELYNGYNISKGKQDWAQIENIHPFFGRKYRVKINDIADTTLILCLMICICYE